MKKRTLILLPGLLALALAGRGEDLIKIETSVTPLRLARGEEGRIILKIAVRPGIAISPQPSFLVEFDAGPELIFPKNFFTAPDLGIPLVDAGGKERLDLSKPVEVSFTVGPKAPRGIHRLEGRVRYFGISAREGWCYKGTAKFSVTFSTRISAAPSTDRGGPTR